MAKQTLTQRVDDLEGCVRHYDDTADEIRKDLRALTKSHNQMREVVFDGLRDRVGEILQKLNSNSVGVPRKTVTLRRILETAVTVTIIGVVILAGVLIVAGRLDADDIANILRAWKGTP